MCDSYQIGFNMILEFTQFCKVCYKSQMLLLKRHFYDFTKSSNQSHIYVFQNVAHRTLCLLLEYIYTGEVVVPADCLSSFAETAKSLHIKGLENIVSIA